MAFEFRLPDIGEGVVEGEVVKWKVKEGELVKLDQPMVEVMTDKATVEIPSPKAGRVAKIMVGEGKICAVGQVMIVIDDGGAVQVTPPSVAVPVLETKPMPQAVVQPAAAPAHHGPGSANGGSGNGGNGKHGYAAGLGHGASAGMHMSTGIAANVPEAVPVAVDVSAPIAARPSGPGQRVLATPSTRKLARELGIDLTHVPASGKNGRVTTDDVKAFKARGQVPSAGVGSTAGAAGGGQMQATTAREPVAIARTGAEERVPFRGVRKAIAANMVRSKFTATHFTYVEEVDMTDMVALRGRAKERAAARGVKLTYLPFIVKAAVAGLKKWPALNASLDEASQEVVYKKYYHVGIATQGPQGLSVAVVRDADKKSIFEIAQDIERLSAAIRDGKATRDDLTGSTFTISSLGQLGGVLATPIINFPESGIMGIHKIAEKPAVRAGQIVIRQLMNLSISVDHRIADGYDGAMLLQEVKTLLEDPTLMFLEMV
jgi:pyruvate dehydrogenase E2 component (dihydrolipoamide acetyltransferase)